MMQYMYLKTDGDVIIWRYKRKDSSQTLYRFRVNFKVDNIIKTGGKKVIKDDHQGIEG